MEKYKNLSGSSSINAYELTENTVTIQFIDDWRYMYSKMKAGSSNIEQMKLLAIKGLGLNSFVNKNVRKLYDKKWSC